MMLRVLSTVVAVFVALLWWRSYDAVEDYVCWRADSTLIVHSKRGRVWFELWRGADPIPVRPQSYDLVWMLRGTTNSASGLPIEVGFTPPPPSPANCFGFWSLTMNLAPITGGQSTGTHRAAALPHWMILAAALLAPTGWMIAHFRRHRRARHGRCPSCGYDLRATPDRCPECGAAPAAPGCPSP